jgi:hypothetical protein
MVLARPGAGLGAAGPEGKVAGMDDDKDRAEGGEDRDAGDNADV